MADSSDATSIKGSATEASRSRSWLRFHTLKTRSTARTLLEHRLEGLELLVEKSKMVFAIPMTTWKRMGCRSHYADNAILICSAVLPFVPERDGSVQMLAVDKHRVLLLNINLCIVRCSFGLQSTIPFLPVESGPYNEALEEGLYFCTQRHGTRSATPVWHIQSIEDMWEVEF